jgi:hypothetical protein
VHGRGELAFAAKPLIGMIHVAALPGTPHSRLAPGAIAARAGEEAALLARAGFDAILIENMHDAPYIAGTQDPAVTAAMTACALAVREAAPNVPLGVQVLACGHREALAIALASGASFVRVENFAFAHVADEGLMPTAEAGPLLRYRRSIGAEGVALWCDVKKKHASHALTADISLAEACHACEFFGADALIVTGQHTGDPAREGDLAEARGGTGLPIVVGSGATPENIDVMFAHADAVIVGSAIKRLGRWDMPPDARRCAEMVRAAAAARRQLAGGGGGRGSGKGRGA